jgi:hypothetical protein
LVEPVLDCAVGAEYFATAAAKLLPQEKGELSLAGLALLAVIFCLRQFPVERGVSGGLGEQLAEDSLFVGGRTALNHFHSESNKISLKYGIKRQQSEAREVS